MPDVRLAERIQRGLEKFRHRAAHSDHAADGDDGDEGEDKPVFDGHGSVLVAERCKPVLQHNASWGAPSV